MEGCWIFLLDAQGKWDFEIVRRDELLSSLMQQEWDSRFLGLRMKGSRHGCSERLNRGFGQGFSSGLVPSCCSCWDRQTLCGIAIVIANPFSGRFEKKRGSDLNLVNKNWGLRRFAYFKGFMVATRWRSCC